LRCFVFVGKMALMRNKTLFLILLFGSVAAFAADTVLVWPASGEANLKFTIGKLRQVNSYSGQADYVAEATVLNLGQKAVPFASFYVYLLDKSQKRIGEGYIELTNLGPGQQAKASLTAHAIGNVASMELQPQHLPSDEPKKVAMRIASVPTGANIKLDGQDVGVTPVTLQLAAGKHALEFSKEGYAPGSAPVEVSAGSLPGAVDFEMAPLTQDTLVLRNGSVLLGDVTAVTMTGVSVKANGKVRSFSRNEVARIIFVVRRTVKKPARRR
jgi:hypothetical protein